MRLRKVETVVVLETTDNPRVQTRTTHTTPGGSYTWEVLVDGLMAWAHTLKRATPRQRATLARAQMSQASLIQQGLRKREKKVTP